ncbi:hypothetical protein QWY77_11815 [Thalassotalea ponticola]|uniref:hypothetical protein n=1 Tax=Thalassotalea ponticola TaxID=1523392 RepID=UPI0025B4DC8B|nr:hypothetical protein [Thalassotalea ponticola]MDN3653429.1 hypothetical protein [Thalassotalea ponticola]
MSALVISEGKEILYHGMLAVIRAFKENFVVIELNSRCIMLSPEKYQKKVLSEHIQTPPMEGCIAPVIPLTSQSEKLSAERYEAYVMPLRDRESNCSRRVIREVIDKVAQERGDTGKNKPSADTVYSWLKKAEQLDFDFVAMVNLKKGKRGEQASGEAVDLFFDIIHQYYFQPTKAEKDQQQGLSQEACWRKYKEAQKKLVNGMPCRDRENYKGMARSTFLAKFASLDPVEVCIAREGYNVARRRFRQSSQHIVVSRPLELVQIDAVHINLGLFNHAGEYVGMPVVFFAIDIFTRAIIGYVIVYAHSRREDLSSAIELLRVSIQAKRKPEHTEHDWPLYGKPEEVRYDSGIFSAKQMSSYLMHVQIRGQQNPVASPWSNGIIERFNLTFREHCCKRIDGYEGKRMQGYKDTQQAKVSACITETEFRKIVETFILDEYHQTEHCGLRKATPAEVAREYKHLVPMLDPAYLVKVNTFRGVETEFTIHAHKGIVRNNVWYNDQTKTRNMPGKLIRIYDKYHKKSKSVKVIGFYSHVDISRISVVDPDTGELFEVPSTTYSEPTSLAQHKALQMSKGPLDLTNAVGRLSPKLLIDEDDEIEQASSSEAEAFEPSDANETMPAEIQLQLEQCISANEAGMIAPPELSEDDAEVDEPVKKVTTVVKKNVKRIKV